MDNNYIESLIENKIKLAGEKFGEEVKAFILEVISLEKLIAQNPEKEAQLIPVTKWNEYYPHPTVAGLKMKVFREKDNGFKDFGVVVRDGKRVLIDDKAFFRWLRYNNEKRTG